MKTAPEKTTLSFQLIKMFRSVLVNYISGRCTSPEFREAINNTVAALDKLANFF